MKTTNLFAILLASLVASSSAEAVTMAWSAVDNPGNAPDPTTGSLYGAVGYAYNIGTYDVTNAQYAEFLNTKDPTGANTLGLWNSSMAAAPGGINFSAGNADGSKYVLSSGRQNHPVIYPSGYSAIRFANWLNNGQGSGDTESGAYTLLGGTPTPSNDPNITRNAGARIFLPSENEWYKAAFYNPGTSSYFRYATSSNTLPTAEAPPGGSNSANWYNLDVPLHGVNDLTDVGAYTGTTSPYGAFDMAGNVYNWTVPEISTATWTWRGSSYNANTGQLPSSEQSFGRPSGANPAVGIRMASIVPEPASLTSGVAAVMALMLWRHKK